MKKILFSIGLSLLLGFAACGSSVDSKIDKVAELAKESKEIQAQMANGDNSNVEKLTQIAAEMAKIGSELEKENLTPEQKERLTKAALGMDY